VQSGLLRLLVPASRPGRRAAWRRPAESARLRSARSTPPRRPCASTGRSFRRTSRTAKRT